MAETWDLTSTQANLDSISTSSAPSLVIPDNAAITDTITVSSRLQIDHIEVDLDLSHSWIGDLVVTLTSPDDTTSVLVNRPGVSPTSMWGSSQDNIDFTLTSTHHWGETGAGTWTLAVSDLVGGDSGVLNSWTLRLLGDSLTDDNTYVYTDEFSTFTGAGDAARRVLNDSGGIDTLNAAAVTSDSIIDLNPGANGVLAGNSLAIASGTVIENAHAGDGNDLLIGNSSDNSLHSGRGDDVLSGGGGNDYLVGGSGDDVLSGGDGDDYFDAGSGANRFVVGAGEANDTNSVSDNVFSTDILQFVSGIGLSDVGFGQSSNDLTISLSETHGGGAVTVYDFFAAGGAQRIDTIEFDGGATVLNVSNYAQLSDFQQPGVNESPTVGDQGFSVAENAAADTVVGTVTANDPDAGDVLSYAITAGNEGNAFAIDAGSGEITVQGGLDFEGLNTYALTIQVTDGGLLADSAAVSIDLTNVNEAPTVGDQGFAINENSAIGSVVGSVAASDPDAGDVLSYAITAGNEDDTFAIDANGVITVQGALNFEALPSYALSVQVTDGGLLSDSAVVALNVTTEDISVISGTPGNDTLVSTAMDETLSGGGGDDTYVYGLGGGDDRIVDSAGVDRLVLGQEADITAFESAGNDLIFSFADGGSVRVADMLDGQAVEELAFSAAPGTVHELRLGASASRGDDWIVGGAGNDDLDGGRGDDWIAGGDGDDIITGGRGSNADRLFGGAGDDNLIGRSGDDILNGGAGNDLLNGGRGDDLFVFTDGDGADRFSSFRAGAGTDDVIDLTGSSAVGGFDDVQSIASQAANNTVIDLGNGDSITLLGVDVGDIHQDDFLF